MLDEARCFLHYYLGIGEKNTNNVTTDSGSAQVLVLAGCLMVVSSQPKETAYGLFEKCIRLYYGILNRERIEENIAEIDRRFAYHITSEEHCTATTLAERMLMTAIKMLEGNTTDAEAVMVAQKIYQDYFV